MVKLNPEIHRQETPVADDIKPPRHREPIVTGRPALNKRVEQLVEARIDEVPGAGRGAGRNRRTGGPGSSTPRPARCSLEANSS